MGLDSRDVARFLEKEINGFSGINSNYFIEEGYSRRSRNHLGLTGFGEDYFFVLENEKDFLRAYETCGPLKAIVGKRSTCFNNAKRRVVKAYDPADLEEDPPTRVNNEQTRKLEKALLKPNALQNEDQFFAQQNIYVDIFGYCPVLIVKPSAMESEITSIWNIPPWLFDIKYTKKWLLQNKISGIYEAYFMEWAGERIELKTENLFFIFDDGIGTQSDTNLTIPDSRLVGHDYDVCNINAAVKSENTLITKRGAVGILSNEAKDRAGVIPLEEDEKKELQQDFKKYGIVGQPYQIIITNATLKWQQIGFATKDLMLLEIIEDSLNSLCDAYQWLPQLMSRGKASSLNGNDRKEAQKQVYRDSIIPQSFSRLDQFMTGIITVMDRPENGGKEYYALLSIYPDFSKVEVLQEDKKLMAETFSLNTLSWQVMYTNRLITPNQWLKLAGLPQVTDPALVDEYNQLYEPPVEVVSTAASGGGKPGGKSTTTKEQQRKVAEAKKQAATKALKSLQVLLDKASYLNGV